MSPIRQLEYMLMMAAADNSLGMAEMKLLKDRCQYWGITKDEFSEAMDRALSPDEQPPLPTDRKSGLQLLANLGEMMAADGEMDEVERGMFEATAQRLGIPPDEWPLPGTARARYMATRTDAMDDDPATTGRQRLRDSTELPDLPEDFDLD